MPTIAEQLTQLEQDRDDLVDNLETKGITGLTGDETFTELVPEILNIPSGGGADLSDYFYSSVQFSATQGQTGKNLIKKFPSPITITNSPNNSLQGIFYNFPYLVEAPIINTTGFRNFQMMFAFCNNLVTVPVYDTSSATLLQNMFTSCRNLSDESINNILLMCINTPSNYEYDKTLSHLGFTSTYYPASRIQALSNYQDFINAGWTIGY